MKNIIASILLLLTTSQTVHAEEPITSRTHQAPKWKSHKMVSKGGRVDWYKGQKHSMIAYDAVTDSLMVNSDLFVIRPHNKETVCVTCKTKIPRGFIGQPAWHPDGEHLVLQAENRNSDHRLLNHMAWGINNDLWLIKKDGTGARIIWSSPLNHAALHPHFNKDGTKIIFAQRVSTGKSWHYIKQLNLGGGGENQWDGWNIHIADFDISKSGKDMLSNHKELSPNSNGFYEVHGYTDDEQIIYSFTPGGRPYVDDIYICDADGNNVRKLIHSPATWDEHGIFSPSGHSMAFVSSRADKNWRAPGSRANSLRTELYLKREGSIIQLTDFNEGGESKKRYLVSDYDWNAAGTKIVYQVVPIDGKRASSPELWMLIFSEPQ